MKKNIILLFILISIFMYACSPYSSRMEYALEFAGENCTELEKVLKHYSGEPEKYQAACFLIENMPHYYSFQHERIELYTKDFYSLAAANHSGDKAIELLEQQYGLLNPLEYDTIYDCHVITAAYLIDNIEWAFKVWKEKPWNKDVSFEVFCETILPYRVDNEPLEYWREYYYRNYQPFLDSLLKNKNDAVEAINVLWEPIHKKQWLYAGRKPYGYPYPGAVTLDSLHRIGDCYEYKNFGVYLMRALGIPGGVDGYLQHPYRGGHHLWNYVYDEKGVLWEFSINGYPPRIASNREKPEMGRVFRDCFGIQKNSLPEIAKRKFDLPFLLNTPFKKDVSDLYLHDASIEVPVSKKDRKDRFLYLCIFSNYGWEPIAWTEWKDGMFTFTHIEKNMLYLPAYYINGRIIPAAYAGSVDEEGKYIAIEPSQETQTIRINRKYPVKGSSELYKWRIKGGQFQAANDSGFKHVVVLHEFQNEEDLKWYHLKFPNHTEKYRYIRYLSGEGGYCNMAEIEFFDHHKNKLQGTVIGTEGSYLNRDNNRKEAAFDGDPLTYYDATEGSGSWTGLELEEPQIIAEVNYIFRNDDNNVRPGDVYELFYSSLHTQGWTSLGIKVADNGLLTYDHTPVNALFWLKNHTRGKEELPFFYQEDKQVFWEM